MWVTIIHWTADVKQWPSSSLKLENVPKIRRNNTNANEAMNKSWQKTFCGCAIEPTTKTTMTIIPKPGRQTAVQRNVLNSNWRAVLFNSRFIIKMFFHYMHFYESKQFTCSKSQKNSNIIIKNKEIVLIPWKHSRKSSTAI